MIDRLATGDSVATGARRRGRELALQLLYQMDVQPDLDLTGGIARFHTAFSRRSDDEGEAVDSDAETREFAERLVRGVSENLAAIDTRITRASRNWRVERMARVDRNLLRIGTYELAYSRDVPAKAAINEAIEIAKRFGAHETPAFVNGILDRVLEELARPV